MTILQSHWCYGGLPIELGRDHLKHLNTVVHNVLWNKHELHPVHNSYKQTSRIGVA